jgi:hypothetical protein
MEAYDNFNNEISVSSNPTSGVLNISTSVVMENLNIFNFLGQIIYPLNPSNKTALIALDAPGICTVRILTADRVITKKVLVNK